MEGTHVAVLIDVLGVRNETEDHDGEEGLQSTHA